MEILQAITISITIILIIGIMFGAIYYWEYLQSKRTPYHLCLNYCASYYDKTQEINCKEDCKNLLECKK